LSGRDNLSVRYLADHRVPSGRIVELPHYAHALLHVYGIPEVILHIPGKRGPKPTPKHLPPTDLPYAQVVKRRKGGRVVEGTTKSIFGSEAAVHAR